MKAKTKVKENKVIESKLNTETNYDIIKERYNEVINITIENMPDCNKNIVIKEIFKVFIINKQILSGQMSNFLQLCITGDVITEEDIDTKEINSILNNIYNQIIITGIDNILGNIYFTGIISNNDIEDNGTINFTKYPQIIKH